jgi:hypothetical protein
MRVRPCWSRGFEQAAVLGCPPRYSQIGASGDDEIIRSGETCTVWCP